MNKKIILPVALVSVIIITSLVVWLTGEDDRKVDIESVSVKTDTVRRVIMAKGYIHPVDQVNVGTQVSGIITKIYVDYNTLVKEGDLLAELDKSLLTEKVTQARAALLSARSDSLFAQKNYNRTKLLYGMKAETEVNLEEASNKLDLAKANIANAASNLHQAKVNLAFAEIRSPITGIVQSRSVEEGQTVAAEFNTPTLFTIANNFRKMAVRANVDEKHISEIRVNQKVYFKVDTYPDEIFRGTVIQIRLEPKLIGDVVNYTIVIDAPNPAERLFPGMTVNCAIIIKEEGGTIVPNKALAFEPADDIKDKLRIAVIKEKNKDSKTVWVQTVKNKIEQREVQTGLSDSVSVVVKTGLTEGDKVVISASLEEK